MSVPESDTALGLPVQCLCLQCSLQRRPALQSTCIPCQIFIGEAQSRPAELGTALVLHVCRSTLQSKYRTSFFLPNCTFSTRHGCTRCCAYVCCNGYCSCEPFLEKGSCHMKHPAHWQGSSCVTSDHRCLFSSCDEVL